MRKYDFSQLTPEWQAFIESPDMERLIAQMATKYMSHDEGLRADAMQEARIGLATVDPEAIKKGDPMKYAANVIRNSILGSLDSYNTGDWYTGRTRGVRDAKTGEMRKVRYPTRFASLDMLTEEYGLEIAEDHTLSWDGHEDDGLDETRPKLEDEPDTEVPPLARRYGLTVSSPSDTEDALVDALDYEASLAKLSDDDRTILEKLVSGYRINEAFPTRGTYYVNKWRQRVGDALGLAASPIDKHSRALLPSHIAHGTATAYRTYRCRCRECKAANAAKHRTWQRTRRLTQRAESALVQHRLRTRAESALARMLNAA